MGTKMLRYNKIAVRVRRRLLH